MRLITAKVDISGFQRGKRLIERQSLPFAQAAFFTALAQDAHAAVKSNVRQAFKLRNTWTEQGIRIIPADKNGTPIQSAVYTDTANRLTGAPDYLARQETGGEKIPVLGRQHIAVPTKYLRQMAPGVIPAELRPKNLLGATDGKFTAQTRKKGSVVRNQKIVRGFVFYIQQLKNGHLAIMGRYVTDSQGYPFYLLIREARVRKSQLRMDETVRRIVATRAERQWDVVWNRIYAGGLRI